MEHVGGQSATILAIKLSNKNGKKIKYIMALDGCCLIFFTQQPPKTHGHNKGGKGEEGGVQGGCDTFILAAIELKTM